ncbi:hypothetical protein GCM10008969_25460 [Pseudomonas veronii subsp. inensis]
MQAAQAAAVAQRLPLLLVELFKGFAYPERFDFGGHGSTSVSVGEKAASLVPKATAAKRLRLAVLQDLSV